MKLIGGAAVDNNGNIINAQDSFRGRNPYKPGKRYGDLEQPRGAGVGSLQEGLIYLGSKKGRDRQVASFSRAMTPEISRFAEKKTLKNAFDLVTRTAAYTAAEHGAVMTASTALGLTTPFVIGPIIAAKRIYDAAYDWRTTYETHMNSFDRDDAAGENRFRDRVKLAGVNVAMAPFDVLNTVGSRAVAFGANFLAGKTFLNKIPGDLAKLDPKLEGFKDVEGLNQANRILDTVDKVSNLLTFGVTAKPKAA